MTVIREPAVAGQFYPGNASELGTEIRVFFEEVQVEGGPAPKALIVPHAGYVYSGPVAATAYARLRPYRDRYTRVILLGPCHRFAVRGLALSGADVFRTPLGDVPLDQDAIAALTMPEITVVATAHEFEHSLEVHLPFLQTVIESFSLVPLVVGDRRQCLFPVQSFSLVESSLWVRTLGRSTDRISTAGNVRPAS